MRFPPIGFGAIDSTRPTRRQRALLALPAELSVEDLIAVEWCSKDLDCVTAESGSLTLTAYEEGIALSGTYAFVLADGSRLEGDLAAQSCDYSPCS